MDSFVRIQTFQWVTPNPSLEIFSRAWVADVSGGTATGLALGTRKGVVAHGLKLIVTSDFMQAILVGPLPFGRFEKQLAVVAPA